MARRLKALVAILLALAAGLFLVSCGRRPTAVTPPPPPPRPAEPAPPAAEPAGEKNVPPPPPKEPEQPKVDKEEHRKGLPVRDNMLE
jgi:outer membrane biosynthesis protein TonB